MEPESEDTPPRGLYKTKVVGSTRIDGELYIIHEITEGPHKGKRFTAKSYDVLEEREDE